MRPWDGTATRGSSRAPHPSPLARPLPPRLRSPGALRPRGADVDAVVVERRPGAEVRELLGGERVHVPRSRSMGDPPDALRDGDPGRHALRDAQHEGRLAELVVRDDELA